MSGEKEKEYDMRREHTRSSRYSIGAASLFLALGMGGALVASGSSGASPTRTRVVTVTFANKGSTMHLHVGDRLRVVLGSAYWTFHKSSNPRAVAQIGVVKVVHQPGCVVGAGCGTVTALYGAMAPGTSAITASRISCGEALGCTKGNGSFNIRVRVSS